MFVRMKSRPWRTGIAAAVVVLAFGVNRASALFPPVVPPPPRGVPPEPPVIVTPPPPVIDVPPPIHGPPPVNKAPEPGTLVMGLIGAGVAGLAARRRKAAE